MRYYLRGFSLSASVTQGWLFPRSAVGQSFGPLAVRKNERRSPDRRWVYPTGMHVPGLRSCYDKVGGIYYIGRMFDKIRLHAAGNLPEEYHANLGKGFDARALTFLDIDYPSLVERVEHGDTDERAAGLVLRARAGARPTRKSRYGTSSCGNGAGMTKGRRPFSGDSRKSHCEHRTDIQTFFDFIDLDEGRDPRENPRDF